MGFEGTPLPHPSVSRDWRGGCKNGLQNLERVGASSQNLENKSLASIFVVRASAASALTIFCFLAGRGQGWTSHGAGGACGFQVRRSQIPHPVAKERDEGGAPGIMLIVLAPKERRAG